MRLILIIVNQTRSKYGTISGVKRYSDGYSAVSNWIKISAILFLLLFREDTRRSLFSQQTCRYNVMTFAATTGSREKSHLFRDDNKFSLSVSLIMSITLGGQIHITFPLYNFLIFPAASSEDILDTPGIKRILFSIIEIIEIKLQIYISFYL